MRIFFTLLVAICFCLIGCTKPKTPSAGKEDDSSSELSAEASKNLSGETPTAKNTRESAPLDTLLAKSLPDGFAGSASCKECHPDRYRSYLLTDHSRSLRRPNLDEELVGVEYFHAPSLRRHIVESRGDQLVHKAIFQPGETEIPIAAEAVQWVVGSGAFAKSYLTQNDSGLFQLPLTHYTAKATYQMSPGYDVPDPIDFRRQISDQCLFCHVGALSRIDRNANHVQIHEAAIGCERCHGAGGGHAEYYSAIAEGQMVDDAEVDRMDHIVHPGKIDREASQSICKQCHLLGNVLAKRPGKNLWDFVPGELLGQTVVHYGLDQADPNETGFVGHFPQLEGSPCYTKSEQLLCVSCHDPHHAVQVDAMPPAERDHHFRQQCYQCHDDEACRMEHETRVRKNSNQCVTCHMPKGKSEVPHASVTNHRIGVYNETGVLVSDSPVVKPIEDSFGFPVPVALNESSNASKADRSFADAVALGQWWLEIAASEKKSPSALDELIRRLRLAFQEIDDVGPRAKVVLARLSYERSEEYGSDLSASEKQRWATKAIKLSQEVAYDASVSKNIRGEAMLVLGDLAFDQSRFEDAEAFYGNLVSIRRYAPDWYNLGLTKAKLRKFDEAESALRRAVEIDALYPDPYRSLGIFYERISPQKSATLFQLSEFLDQFPH